MTTRRSLEAAAHERTTKKPKSSLIMALKALKIFIKPRLTSIKQLKNKATKVLIALATMQV